MQLQNLNKRYIQINSKICKWNALFMSLVIRYDYIVTNRRIEGKISPNSFDIYEGIINLDIAK